MILFFFYLKLEECLKQWLDLCILKQLKLLVTFLKRFSSTNKLTISNGHERTGNSSRLLSSCSDLGRLLAARVTQHFIKHKDGKHCLYLYNLHIT